MSSIVVSAQAQSSALMTCQIDSYAKTSIDRVLATAIVGGKAANTQKFVMTLDNSVLYPEGGGQPSDYGTVHGHAFSDLRKSQTSLGETAIDVIFDEPFAVEVGSNVESIVDWTRRFDLMQQHTAQHLMSAIAQKLFDAETIGWNLGVDSVTVDLAIPSLSVDQINQLESEINDFIATGAEVSWVVHEKEALSGLDLLRGAPKGAAAEVCVMYYYLSF